jgi:hypothetical protein
MHIFKGDRIYQIFIQSNDRRLVSYIILHNSTIRKILCFFMYNLWKRVHSLSDSVYKI